MNKKTYLIHPLFLAIPLLGSLVYYLAFFPGLMSFDSVYQWDQIATFKINNWHPAYHTIVMWLLSRIWYSPAVVSLFQVLVFSLIVGYGLTRFWEAGTPRWILLVVGLFIAVWPLTGMLEVTLWKDILYSNAVLLLTIYLFVIVNSHGEWLSRRWNWLYLGLTLTNVSLLRHNGFPVALITVAIILVIFSNRIFTIRALAVWIITTLFILGPVYTWFKVDQSYSQSVGIPFVHPVAAHLVAGTQLVDEDRNYLSKIFPLVENQWPYSCYDATVSFYSGFNFQPVIDDPFNIIRIFSVLTIQRPFVTIEHFYCLSSFVWQINQPGEVYLETVLTSQTDISARADWKNYRTLIHLKTKFPHARKGILTLVKIYNENDPAKILWRPAIYFYLLIGAAIFYTYRLRSSKMLVLLTPTLVQTLVIMFTAQLQAVRYQFPVYLIALLFVAPLISLGLKSKPIAIPDPLLSRLS